MRLLPGLLEPGSKSGELPPQMAVETVSLKSSGLSRAADQCASGLFYINESEKELEQGVSEP